LLANRMFYQALTSLDLEAMTGVWLHEEWVCCVHPGWPQVEGWEAVRASFEQIFEHTERLLITVSRTSVHQEQDMAWISCLEKISSSGPGRIDTSFAQATNLFVRRQGRWRMVQHHASHLPVEMRPPDTERVN
jgi:ketosteroid isomerase-like protein